MVTIIHFYHPDTKGFSCRSRVTRDLQLNFLFRQSPSAIHTPAVNRLICRLDLTLVQRAVMFRRGGGEALVQLQHLLDERHPAVVAGPAYTATAS